MKKLHSFNNHFIAYFLVFFLFSCSSDDGTDGGESTLTANSIELKPNNTSGSARINETIIFTVKGDDGKDYTNKSTIYLNGEPLGGKSYKFSESGLYSFTAKMQNLTSEIVTISVENAAVSEPEAITLSTNKDSPNINMNETVTFRVLGDNDIEYTSLSDIKVNGESIDGNQFTFKNGGEHSITATYNDLNSNALDIRVMTENFISLSANKILRGQNVNFEFFGSEGTKATENVTFYVNGSPVNGNSFSSQNEGAYSVTAKMEGGEETEAKSFEIFTPVRKALFEDYTGTWCGWCPRVTNAILTLKERTDDLVVVAVHFQDEMMIEEALSMVAHFEIEMYPHARLNRTFVLEYPEDEEPQLERVMQVAGKDSPYSIAINTALKNNLLDIQVKLISEIPIPANHKLVVYLLQNGVIFPQFNYLNNDSNSRWYQAGDPITDFIHDEVLEASLTNIFGDPLVAIPALEEAVFEFDPVDLSIYSYSTTGNRYNPNNFEVVAILTTEDNTALNAQKVTAGQNAEFE